MSSKISKILVVIPFAFHRESGSSLSSYYRVLALAEITGRVDVITTPHGKNIFQKNISITRTPGCNLFKTYQPGEYGKRLIYEFFLFFKLIESLSKNKYDAVIIHGSSIYWAFWLQGFYKIPFIAMVHGNIQTELEKWGISKITYIKKLAARIENYIINTFKLIIAEHEAVKNILIKAGIRKDKILVIRICVKSVPPIQRQSDVNIFTVLYTGTFVKIQNLNLLYRTATLLKKHNIKFLIVGGIEKEIKDELKKINEYGVVELVNALPRVDQKDLTEFYRMANIVISPREFGHDTPMKIFDYLNYGKCILATNRPIHKGILNNDIACLAEPDPESFAEKILFLMHNPSEVELYEEKAKKFFEKNFEFQIMTRQYKKLINMIECEKCA